MAFVRAKSVHGRELGLTSTGGLVSAYGSTGRLTGSFDAIAVMTDSTWARLTPFREPLVAASSSGATLSNSGVSLLSSATATARTFSIAAPVAGVYKEIISQASASSLIFSATSTAQTFYTSSGVRTGTTSLTLISEPAGDGTFGNSIALRGVSATRWAVISSPVPEISTDIIFNGT